MNSLVSIIIPAYNSADYISQTLESVVKQTHTNWECLIINDGSTDKTAEIIESFAANEKRIQCFHKANGGLCSARNYGLSRAKGNYIQYLDSDDVLFEDKILLMVEEYKRLNTAHVILYCDFMYGCSDNPYQKSTGEFKLDNNFKPGKKVGFSKIYNGWDYNITIPIHCFLFPSNIVKNIFFDETLKSKEDWNYHLSVLDKNNIFLQYDYVGCSYRVTENSMSKDYTSMIASSLQILHRWRKNRFEYFYRMSFYILQGFIYKMNGKKISLTPIRNFFKDNHNNYVGARLFVALLLPVTLFFKIFNSIRIRIK